MTPALLLLAPVIHLLRSHGYPLLRLEVGLLAAGTVLTGLVLGVALHRARPTLRLPFVVVILAVVWDLYFGKESLRWGVISVGTLILLVLALREHITTIVFAVSLALVVSTLAPPIAPVASTQQTWPAAAPDTALPPVFHFVLDEHGGMAGLAEDTALIRHVTAWYQHRGFRLFPNAYSPYSDTYNSLPNLVNFVKLPVDARHLQLSPGATPVLRSNRYFDAMRERGYRIRVYQSDFLDFCRGASPPALASCFTYPANSASYAAAMPLPTSARVAQLAHYVLANRSYVFTAAVRAYERGVRSRLAPDGAEVPLPDGRGSHISPPVTDILDRIEGDLTHGARGTLFFAHLLSPHFPYQYDAQCRVHARVRDRLDRASPSAPNGVDNTPASRTRRLEIYSGQVRCLVEQLNTFFARLDELGVYAPAIVVLHGDHGSRIVIRRPVGGTDLGRLTRQDLLDGFSTLFAVKAPAIPVGADTSWVAIGDVLAQLVASNFRSASVAPAAREEPVVYLVDRPNGRMIPMTFPDPRQTHSERMLRNVIE